MRHRPHRPHRSPSAHHALPWLTMTLFVLVAIGVGIPLATEAAETTTYTVHRADLAAARALFDGMPVKGRAPSTGYTREQFGQAWADVDRNGCDTRNDVLRRDLTGVVPQPGTNGCVVLSGTLADPYGARSIRFARGEHSDAVQIDHLVALSNAWQTGAQRLSVGQRESFANDPANLQSVDGPLNQEKGAGDAATWLPPNKGFRCAYVMRQVRVKAAYGLWVTRAEHEAIDRELGRCIAVD